ncbi:zinc ABC transporter substrate-binding protein [Microcoleus sp. FACHB-1515]|uniref:metal ABC transporter solute-binding protein, Zn/Mn family n=1 Tax=Cyanophyceae TaxID=3028117 RepID=UPI001685FA79|nr:zinc ABC transporter substrate-binding protein [Microcoleus sp. FACHB-1515]MBD2092425.1 zinc ABC transporter substrate-binding protein [Microcoleus sp. FACHB-1515]
MKIFTPWRFGLLALTASLVACNASTSTNQAGSSPTAQSPAATETLKVVATGSVLCDLAETIAAETIDLTCLVQAGVDPHVYEPTPADRRAIEDAEVILYFGYDFEPSLIRLIEASSSAIPKVAVGEEAVPNPLMGEHSHAHGEEKDEEHGHDHAEGEAHDHAEDEAHAEGETPDPHVWHSAENGIRMVEVIENTLSEAAPANAELYARNAEALTTELTQINDWIKAQVATIPANSRKLVTTHDALGYFAEAYGIPVEGALQGLSTDEQPTAARVRELTEEIQASQVPTIFAEATENTQLLETVAKEANVKISDRELFADGLGEAGSAGDTYPKMLIANTQAIVEGLGGQFTPFQPQ